MLESAKRKVREWEKHVEIAQSAKAEVEDLKAKRRKGGNKGMYDIFRVKKNANLKSKDALIAAQSKLESAEKALQVEKDHLAQLELGATVGDFNEVTANSDVASGHMNMAADQQLSTDIFMSPDPNEGTTARGKNAADNSLANFAAAPDKVAAAPDKVAAASDKVAATPDKVAATPDKVATVSGGATSANKGASNTFELPHMPIKTASAGDGGDRAEAGEVESVKDHDDSEEPKKGTLVRLPLSLHLFDV
jgi:hypothetical protein